MSDDSAAKTNHEEEAALTPLPTIRRHRRSAPLLSVVLVAWLGIVAAPCAMAWNGSVSEQADERLVETHDNCPSAKDDTPMAAEDCCCEVDAARTNDAPQFFKNIPWVAITVEIPIDLRPIPPAHVIQSQRPPTHETSPPVYLTTQRFRL